MCPRALKGQSSNAWSCPLCCLGWGLGMPSGEPAYWPKDSRIQVNIQVLPPRLLPTPQPHALFPPHAAPGTIIFVEPEFLRICFGRAAGDLPHPVDHTASTGPDRSRHPPVQTVAGHLPALTPYCSRHCANPRTGGYPTRVLLSRVGGWESKSSICRFGSTANLRLLDPKWQIAWSIE